MDNLCIIIPLYNEEKVITAFYNELIKYIDEGTIILFIDDGSEDNTLNILDSICLIDKRVKVLSLSRNFGHQKAIIAGMTYATGDVFIIMDGDLQHPPFLIPQLLKKMDEGFDIASAKRNSYKHYSIIKKITSFLFYKLLNFISNYKIEPQVADFRAFNKNVYNAVLKFSNENNIFLRGIFSWIGFNQTYVKYEINERKLGFSKYSMKKMISLSLDGFTSFSVKPLRIVIYLGIVFSFIGFLFGIYALIEFYKGNTIQGWTSLIIVSIFIGGIQILLLGVVGEYIGKMFLETKKRPIFLIKKQINF